MASKASPSIAGGTFYVRTLPRTQIAKIDHKNLWSRLFSPFLFFSFFIQLEPLSKNGFQAKPLWSIGLWSFLWKKTNLRADKERIFRSRAAALTLLFSLMGWDASGALGNRFFCSLKTQLSKYTFKTQKIVHNWNCSLIFISYHLAFYIAEKWSLWLPDTVNNCAAARVQQEHL